MQDVVNGTGQWQYQETGLHERGVDGHAKTLPGEIICRQGLERLLSKPWGLICDEREWQWNIAFDWERSGPTKPRAVCAAASSMVDPATDT